MSRIDELGEIFREIFRRIHDLETTQPVGYTSVTEGQLRVASNEGLLVEGSAKVEGWLIVTGTERVTGTLEVLGQFILSGPASITGALDITGPTIVSGSLDVTGPWKLTGTGQITGNTTGTGALTWSGPWDFSGNGDITGDVDVTGDMNLSGTTWLQGNLWVTSGGKIIAGDLIIDPSGGGSIAFPGGARVSAGEDGGITVYNGSYRLTAANSFAGVFAGMTGIIVNPGGFRMAGMDTATDTGLAPGTVISDAGGWLMRVIS